MKKNGLRLRVGITLASLAALLFVFVFSLNSTLSFWRGAKTMAVTFRNVQGIRKDDPVHFHGVPCGRVAKVMFTTAAGESLSHPEYAIAHAAAPSGERAEEVAVRLELEIPEEVYSFLRTGSQVVIDKTLTGVTVVQISQGAGGALAPGAILAGTENASIGEVTRQMNEAVGEVTGILAHVRSMVRSAEDRDLVVGLLATLNRVVGKAEEFTDLMHALVDENRAAVGSLMGNSAKLSGDLQSSAQKLPGTIDQISGAAGDIAALTRNAQGWFLETRPHLSATAEEIANTATQFSKFARELRSRPWRLLHSPSEEEEEKRDLYQCLEQYAQGAVELRRCLEQVRALLADQGHTPGESELLGKTLLDLEQRLARQRSFEEGFWERLQQLPESD